MMMIIIMIMIILLMLIMLISQLSHWNLPVKIREFKDTVLTFLRIISSFFEIRERGSAPNMGGHSTICLLHPNASVQWQPDGLTIHIKMWFLGAGFLGAPPISLKQPAFVLEPPDEDSKASFLGFGQMKRGCSVLVCLGG